MKCLNCTKLRGVEGLHVAEMKGDNLIARYDCLGCGFTNMVRYTPDAPKVAWITGEESTVIMKREGKVNAI